MLASTTASAEEAPSGAPAASAAIITEAELLSRVEKHPRLEEPRATVDAARAEEAAAGALPNPEVSYQREEVFPDAGAAADQFALLSWRIDLSGRRGARVAVARAGTRAAQADAERARQELLLGALAAYHDAAHEAARLAALREGRDGLAQAVAAMRARATAGDVAGYDADRLALELATLDDLITDATIEVDRAERTLARGAGGTEERLTPADPPALPADPPALAALLDGAVEGRADVRATRSQAEQAARAVSAARRAWIPSLILTGGLKSSDLGDETATGYVAGIAIDLPIFDHGQGDRARAVAARRLADTQARILEREIPSKIREAHAALVARLAQARGHIEKQAPLAADLVRRAEAAYREGERPIVEVVDAYRTARETRLRALDLVREARRAEIDLWRALGRRP